MRKGKENVAHPYGRVDGYRHYNLWRETEDRQKWEEDSYVIKVPKQPTKATGKSLTNSSSLLAVQHNYVKKARKNKHFKKKTRTKVGITLKLPT